MKAKFYLSLSLLCALVFVTALILIRETIGVSAGSPSTLLSNPPEAPRVRLAVGEFDPLVNPEPAGLPSALRLSAYPGDGTGYYLVQFQRPIATSDVDALSAAGAQVFDYIPDFTFIVKMDNAARAKIERMGQIRWVGLYQPAYRLPADLRARSSISEAAPETCLPDGKVVAPQDLWDDSPIEVIVTIFRGEELSPIIAQIRDMGGVILDQSQTEWKSKLKVSIALSRLIDIAAISGVRWIEEAPKWELLNDKAADIMDVRDVWNTHGLYGNGQTIAVCDTGLDKGSASAAFLHDDFEDGSGNSRVVAIQDWVGDGASDVNSGHGTHVAGSVLGNGDLSGATPSTHSYPNTAYVGMAPEARLVFQAVENNSNGSLSGIPSDLNTLFAQAASSGAALHTNSWGSSGVGIYTSTSEDVDEYVWNHKDFTILFAAGNSGIDSNADGVVDFYSVGSPGTAKNCVTVGATENDRPNIANTWGSGWPTSCPVNPIKDDRIANNPSGMAAFSSRGPTLDGRYKPDIVAPGTFIASVRSSVASETGWGVIDANYMYMGGTSMATPLAAGAATIVRQYYTDREGIVPSAALIKATLVNGATDINPGQYGTGAGREIPGTRPTNVAGWGRVNLENSIFPTAPRTILYDDETTGLSTSGYNAYTYTVLSSDQDFRVTLAWSDYPGSPVAAGGLVNDLDLRITGPNGVTYYPNNARQRGASQHLTYDDGIPTGYAGWSSGKRIAVRFTPTSYPVTVQTGLFYLGSTTYPKTFNWYLYDGNATSGPANVLASGSTTIRRAGWHAVDLSGTGVTISSGDFFLAIELPDSDLKWFYDATSPIEGHSWDYSDGAWTKWTQNDYMFNAIIASPAVPTNQDRVNNLEGIDISSPATGIYTVTVSGYNVPYGPQPYALVASGIITGGGKTSGSSIQYVYLPLVLRNYAPAPSGTPTPTSTPGGPTPTTTPTWTPTPTATPSKPMDGQWCGRTDQNLACWFTVGNNGTSVSQFTLRVYWGGTCGVAYTEDYFYDISIVNNAFSRSESNRSLSGNFTSPSTASGTYWVRLVVGSCTATKSGTWTANYPCPTPTPTQTPTPTPTYTPTPSPTPTSTPTPTPGSPTPTLTSTPTATPTNTPTSTPTPTPTPTLTPTPTPPSGVLLFEGFESWPPSGWSIINNGGSCVWESTATTGRTNNTGGTGYAADADSMWCGGGAMNTELRTPVLNLSGQTQVWLIFKFEGDLNLGDGYVDISTNGGSTWVNLLHYNQAIYPGPRTETINLTPYVGSANTVIRFHFVASSWAQTVYRPLGLPPWWEVDEVTITNQSP